MKLIDVPKALATDEMCPAYVEAMRWPKGIRCMVCGALELVKQTVKAAIRHALVEPQLVADLRGR